MRWQQSGYFKHYLVNESDEVIAEVWQGFDMLWNLSETFRQFISLEAAKNAAEKKSTLKLKDI